jgi:hypothetical protein
MTDQVFSGRGKEWHDPFEGDVPINAGDPILKQVIAALARMRTMRPEQMSLVEAAHDGGLLTTSQVYMASQHPLIVDVLEDILDERCANRDRRPISTGEIQTWTIDLWEVMLNTHEYAEEEPGVDIDKLWKAVQAQQLDQSLLFKALYIPELRALIIKGTLRT